MARKQGDIMVLVEVAELVFINFKLKIKVQQSPL
jgi:hypothetical protein